MSLSIGWITFHLVALVCVFHSMSLACFLPRAFILISWLDTPLHFDYHSLDTLGYVHWSSFYTAHLSRAQYLIFCLILGSIFDRCDDRTSHCFCFCLFSLVLLLTFRDYNSILEYCLCYPSFAWYTHRLSHWMSFSLWTYACVLWYDVLFFLLEASLHLHIVVLRLDLSWRILSLLA